MVFNMIVFLVALIGCNIELSAVSHRPRASRERSVFIREFVGERLAPIRIRTDEVVRVNLDVIQRIDQRLTDLGHEYECLDNLRLHVRSSRHDDDDFAMLLQECQSDGSPILEADHIEFLRRWGYDPQGNINATRNDLEIEKQQAEQKMFDVQAEFNKRVLSAMSLAEQKYCSKKRRYLRH